VVNCNLQRLDGPVRGNGRIIDELEALFAGAGWNVIKLVWGSDWDGCSPRQRRRPGRTLSRHGGRPVPDLRRQGRRATTASTSSARTRPWPARWSQGMTDEQIDRLKRGGHDLVKIHAAYTRRGATGPAHGDPGPHQEGLRHGRSRAGQDDHAPAEEARREALIEFRNRFLPLTDEQAES
jgi:pyruvate dehydrogenase E1 component